MNRISSFNVTRFCAKAGVEDDRSSRPAVKGTARHALWSGADPHLERLTDRERDDVLECDAPPDCVVHGVVLRYAEASGIESELTLNQYLQAVPVDSPDIVFKGHPDVWWLRDLEDGRKCLFVGDLKSRGTIWGCDSLQLHGYGMTLAALQGADCYCCGELDLSRGTWLWGELVDFHAEMLGGAMLETLYLAATNTEGGYALGNHCEFCYQRDRCPAYLLPPEALGESELRELNALEDLDNERALELYQTIARVAKSVEWAQSQLKAFSELNNGISDGNGKVWRQTLCRGRETVQLKVLREQMGSEAERFIRRGESYTRSQWVKA